MDRRQGVDRFDFHNNRSLNKQVETKAHIEARRTIADRYGDLSLDGQSNRTKFFIQTVFVDRLQETRAQLAVHRKRGVKHSLANPVQIGTDGLGVSVPSVPFVHPLCSL